MGVVQALAGAVSVVDCKCRSVEVVQFLYVRPVNPVKNLENIGSCSKTMVGWGSVQSINR